MFEQSKARIENDAVAAAHLRAQNEAEFDRERTQHAAARGKQQQENALLAAGLNEMKAGVDLSRRENEALLRNYAAEAARAQETLKSDLLKARSDKLSFEKKFLEADRRGRCIACEDASQTVVTLPCKHLAYCVKCRDDAAVRAKEKGEHPFCPICRSPIKSCIEVIGQGD